MGSDIRIPSLGGAIGSVPARNEVQARDTGPTTDPRSFNEMLGEIATQPAGNVTAPLKFSAHAAARMQSRKLDMNSDQMRALNEAVNKAAAKGLDETLVLTKDSAFIVSVKNRTVVTAMDRDALQGNVFTNIDGAVII